MKDWNIVTLNKNKGGRSDCNNYSGISLLNITGSSLCSGYSKLSTEICRLGLFRVRVRFHIRTLHNRHDLLPMTASGEMQKIETAVAYCFHGPDKAFDLVSQDGLKMVHCPIKEDDVE